MNWYLCCCSAFYSLEATQQNNESCLFLVLKNSCNKTRKILFSFSPFSPVHFHLRKEDFYWLQSSKTTFTFVVVLWGTMDMVVLSPGYFRYQNLCWRRWWRWWLVSTFNTSPTWPKKSLCYPWHDVMRKGNNRKNINTLGVVATHYVLLSCYGGDV